MARKRFITTVCCYLHNINLATIAITRYCVPCTCLPPRLFVRFGPCVCGCVVLGSLRAGLHGTATVHARAGAKPINARLSLGARLRGNAAVLARPGCKPIHASRSLPVQSCKTAIRCACWLDAYRLYLCFFSYYDRLAAAWMILEP